VQCSTIWMLDAKGGDRPVAQLPGGELRRSEPQEFPGAACDNMSHVT